MTHAIQTASPGHYRVKNVVKSELTKIMTLPSTAITLGVTVMAGLLVTGLVTNNALNHGYNGFDPTQEALTGLIVAASPVACSGRCSSQGNTRAGPSARRLPPLLDDPSCWPPR